LAARGIGYAVRSSQENYPKRNIMNRKSLLWLSSIAAVAIVAAILFWPAKKATLAMPDLLPRPGETTPSAEFLKSEADVKKYRAELAEHPDKIEDYVKLAEVYLQESRVTANHHFYMPVASALLDETLRRDPNNFEALVTDAGLQMTLHQFQKADEMVMNAIRENPYNATSYGVLCDANVELGHYHEAVDACDSMMSKRPDLRSYARASYLRQLMGKDSAAIQAMLLSADAGLSGSESRSWALYQLGNLYFQSGKLDTAAFIYNGILEERPGYAYAKSGLAMIHLARAEYTDAIRELATAMQSLPEHIFLEQLADVYLAMGDAVNGRTLETRVFSAFDMHEQDGYDVDREYAQFAADHGVRLDEAVTRAEREWKRRPNNADAIETYAWALYKKGDTQKAETIMELGLKSGIVTPTMHYHAAIIYAALGQNVKAQHEWQSAVVRMPYTRPALAHDTKTFLASHNLLSMK
jgi:tetratricopeptide (TPR) repeat protein